MKKIYTSPSTPCSKISDVINKMKLVLYDLTSETIKEHLKECSCKREIGEGVLRSLIQIKKSIERKEVEKE